jgi:hypothetical protein
MNKNTISVNGGAVPKVDRKFVMSRAWKFSGEPTATRRSSSQTSAASASDGRCGKPGLRRESERGSAIFDGEVVVPSMMA